MDKKYIPGYLEHIKPLKKELDDIAEKKLNSSTK
jgi:hypothetical protein